MDLLAQGRLEKEDDNFRVLAVPLPHWLGARDKLPPLLLLLLLLQPARAMACASFKMDLSAEFGMCTCGFKKGEHGSGGAMSGNARTVHEKKVVKKVVVVAAPEPVKIAKPVLAAQAAAEVPHRAPTSSQASDDDASFKQQSRRRLFSKSMV